MAGLTVITEPSQEPVTLQEVKEYLRVDDATDERVIRPCFPRYRKPFMGRHENRTILKLL